MRQRLLFAFSVGLFCVAGPDSGARAADNDTAEIRLDAEAFAAVTLALDDMKARQIEIFNPGLAVVREGACWKVSVRALPKVDGERLLIPMPGTASNITYVVCNGAITDTVRQK